MNAKEAAAARRARILAKGSSRMAIVSGEAAPSVLSSPPATPASPSTSASENVMTGADASPAVYAPEAASSSTPQRADETAAGAADATPSKDDKPAEAKTLTAAESTSTPATPAAGAAGPETPAATAEADAAAAPAAATTASGEDSSATASSGADTPISKSSRPLAARRNRIQQAAAAAVSDGILEAASSEVLGPDSSDTPSKSPAPGSASASAPKSPAKAKSIKEIEEEVARATAAFDAQQLGGDDSSSSSSSSSRSSGKGKGKSTSADDDSGVKEGADSSRGSDAAAGDGAKSDGESSKSAVATAPVTAVPRRSAPMSMKAIMRIVRMLLLLLLGLGTGYRTFNSPEFNAASQYHEHMVSRQIERQRSGAGASARTMGELLGLSYNPDAEMPVEEEVAEWIKLAEEQERDQYHKQRLLEAALGGDGESDAATVGVATPGSGQRTWVQWGTQRVMDHVDCSISAVGVVWWTASLITPVVDAALGVSSRLGAAGGGGGSKFNVMDFVMNIRPRIRSYFFSYFGEVCVHMLGVLLALFVMPVIVEMQLVTTQNSAATAAAGAVGSGATISLMEQAPGAGSFAKEL